MKQQINNTGRGPIESVIAVLSELTTKCCLTLIKGYQTLMSPLTVPSCRFYPSCSEYMSQQIQEKGPIRGIAKGVAQLSKCHPFHTENNE